MRKRLAIGLATLLTMPALGDPPHFHPAQTEPEKALDMMLHFADRDKDQLGHLFHRPGTKGRVDYARILTPKLIAAMAKAERAALGECGGRYGKGELCGLDFSPITCAQDDAPDYFYHTILDLGSKVVIEYAWPNGTGRTAVYTLTDHGKGWRIDGISCANGTKFN